MKIAIVGGGISGLVAAHLLHPEHDVVLYDGGERPGDPAGAPEAEVGAVRAAAELVAYDETTSPALTRLLRELGVATQPASMTFSVRDERTGREWCAAGLDGWFAQRLNVLRPSFHRMLVDLARFRRDARALAAEGPDGVTLGEWTRARRYSRAFVEGYLLPLGAAIWSADPIALPAFPARTFARWLESHRCLGGSGRASWQTVTGGARSYVDRIVAPLGERVRRARVREVRRAGRGVEVVAEGCDPERFDRAVLATHADEALALLADATPAEREVLGAIPYQRSVALLHTDPSVLPRAARARATWNALVPARPGPGATLTCDLHRLQPLAAPEPLLLSLNLEERIDPRKVLRRTVSHHPVFTPAAIRAQLRHAELDGAHRVHFAGAYWGYGFPEDGVRSALAVAARIRATTSPRGLRSVQAA